MITPGYIYRLTSSLFREREKARSQHWQSVRDAFLKAHPTCAACGGRSLLQVHHVEPFHLHPELELDPGNLITLCMSTLECHENLGHGGNWRARVPAVRELAADVLKRPWIRSAVEATAARTRCTTA